MQVIESMKIVDSPELFADCGRRREKIQFS